MFEEYTLHTAKVIDLEDADKQGKVKIKVLPEMEKLEDDVLPWAMPFVTHLSENTLENDLPELNSVVRVLVDKTWKRFYYLGNRYFYGLYDFSNVTNMMDSLENVDTEYVNLHFRMFADGSLMFHNDLDGSHGFMQSTGSYSVFDADGSLIINIVKDVKVTQENDFSFTQKGAFTASIDKEASLSVSKSIDVKGDDALNVQIAKAIALKSTGSSLLTIGNAVATLGNIFVELMDDLASLVTIGSPGTHTSPKLTAEMNALKAKTQQVFD